MKGNHAWETVTVRIAGEDHVLRSPADPEYTRACAALVDRRIRELRERTGLIEGHRGAILAALSLADELFRAQKELEALRSGVESASCRLEAQIEAALIVALKEPAPYPDVIYEGGVPVLGDISSTSPSAEVPSGKPESPSLPQTDLPDLPF